MEVKFMKLASRAKLPTYAYEGDAGLDLYTLDDLDLPQNYPILAGTGLVVEIPEGYEGQIRPRSSLALRGVVAHFGTIDSGYRGELRVVLTAQFADSTLAAGCKIAQLVIKPCPRIVPVEVATLRLPDTGRGAGGFGSSGS